jgi:hypothetical protein
VQTMSNTTKSLDDLIQHSFRRAELLNVPIPPDFDESRYLAQYPDVAKAVKSGKLASGFEHYVRYGRAEGRDRPTRVDR